MAEKQSSKMVYFEFEECSKSSLGLHLASETVKLRGDDFGKRYHFASDTTGETVLGVS